MIGGIIGDVVGSIFEVNPIKTKDFDLISDRSRFTDDSVLTVAVADAVMNGKDYKESILEWGRKFPKKRYGTNMQLMILGESNFNSSFGNGASMRISAIPYLFDTVDEILLAVDESARPTHDTFEAIIGAQAIALAIYLARIGKSKGTIKEMLINAYGYPVLSKSLDEIREGYVFNTTAYGTVPEAIVCFLESTSYEDAIRNAISLAGDADTLACMAGGIAKAYYKVVPKWIETEVRKRLPEEMLKVIDQFEEIKLI